MANKRTKACAKTRSKNFSEEEINVLIDWVDRKREVFFGPLKGPNLTQYHRDLAWSQLCEAVNAVGITRRTISDLKKKFKDLKVRTKQKANAIKRAGGKTGGGENEHENYLNAIDDKIIQFIGKESIEGIPKGVDTFRPLSTADENLAEPSTSCSSSNKQLQQNSEILGLNNTDFFVENEHNIMQQHEYTRDINHSLFESPVTQEILPNPEAPSFTDIVPEQPAPVHVIPPKKGKKNKTLAMEQIKKTTELQEEANYLLKEMLAEFRDFKTQVINIKKRKLEILEEQLLLKKRKV